MLMDQHLLELDKDVGEFSRYTSGLENGHSEVKLASLHEVTTGCME